MSRPGRAIIGLSAVAISGACVSLACNSAYEGDASDPRGPDGAAATNAAVDDGGGRDGAIEPVPGDVPADADAGADADAAATVCVPGEVHVLRRSARAAKAIRSISIPGGGGFYSTNGPGWLEPGAIGASDGVAASTTLTGTKPESQWLFGLDLGFRFPPGAKLRGVRLLVNARWQVPPPSGGIRFPGLGTEGGGFAFPTDFAGGSVSIKDGVTSFGGDLDLWGQTWTVADLESALFGAVIMLGANLPPPSPSDAGPDAGSATGLVDEIALEAFYDCP